MTKEQRWRKWAAAPYAMSAADRAQFKEEWKQHAHPIPSCSLCRLGEKIGKFIARDEERKSEALAANRAEISEDSEVERVATNLARLNKTQPEFEKERVGKLLKESAAKASTEQEAARRELSESGDVSSETLERVIIAKLTPKMVPYESLISKAGAEGEKAIPIVNPFWNKNSDSDTARISIWTKLTVEGLYEAADRFVTRTTASEREKIDLRLAERKPLGAVWFQEGPTLLFLIDSVEKVCGDIPFVARFTKKTRYAIEIAKKYEQAHAAIRAERMVFRIIRNAGLHESPSRRKQLLDQWEEEVRAHWKDAIIRQLNKQRDLPSSIVWQINELRQRGASTRSKRAAETRRVKASKKRAS